MAIAPSKTTRPLLRSLPAALALLVCGQLACSGPEAPKLDAKAKGALRPEDRFGNDPELVADFANLKVCTFEGGRLDQACPQVGTLRSRLAIKGQDPDRRSKVATTLANLLESKLELTRLAAAESLFFFHREPKITSALKLALAREKAPTVKATLLRQACWTPAVWVLDAARRLLLPPSAEAVRAEAATCLGRHPRAAKSAQGALRTALEKDPSARVRGDACAALGSHTAHDAVPAMSAALKDRQIGWRCGAALAAVGSKEAYEALVAGIAAARASGHLPAQYPAALTSFARRPFFDGARVATLLAAVVADRRLGWIARQRATLELGRIKGGLPHLRRLQGVYRAAKLGDTDAFVVKTIDRLIKEGT